MAPSGSHGDTPQVSTAQISQRRKSPQLLRILAYGYDIDLEHVFFSLMYCLTQINNFRAKCQLIKPYQSIARLLGRTENPFLDFYSVLRHGLRDRELVADWDDAAEHSPRWVPRTPRLLHQWTHVSISHSPTLGRQLHAYTVMEESIQGFESLMEEFATKQHMKELQTLGHYVSSTSPLYLLDELTSF